MTTRSIERGWVWLLVLLLGAAVAPAARAAEDKKPSKKPNIVFILMDDLGFADLNCQGSKFYSTPNIDRLARQGMRFTQAYTACPVCSPTRASIMTGKYPARIRLTNFLAGNLWPKDSPIQPVDWELGLRPTEVTLAAALKAGGYRTGFVGKWHLGKLGPERFGFDENLNVNLGGGVGKGYFDKEGRYLTDKQTDAAVQFLDKNKKGPFFLYVCYNAVHVPLQAPKDLVAKYEAKAKANPPAGPVFGKDNGVKVRLVQNHPVYAGMVENMDDNVGRLLQKLKDLGIDDNTVVIFFSDNGGLCSAEGWPTSNLPLRLGKGWLYEGGVRVPLIVRWPGKTKAGSTCEVPMISTDFYPTLLEIADLQPRPKQAQDGQSIVPLLKGERPPGQRTLYWHYPHYSNQGGPPGGAVRSGDMKLIEFYEDGKLELYDLKKDPGEKTNLAARMPQSAQELQRMLQTWRQSIDAQMPQRKK